MKTFSDVVLNINAFKPCSQEIWGIQNKDELFCSDITNGAFESDKHMQITDAEQKLRPIDR